jgi:3-methyladenine DNA glycosylase AlkD
MLPDSLINLGGLSVVRFYARRFRDARNWQLEERAEQMKHSPETVRLSREIRSRIGQLPVPNTPAVRAVRREVSRRIASAAHASVVQLALHLLTENSDLLRFFSYEIVSHHKLAWKQLTTAELLELGSGLNSWSAVDCFAMLLSGPMWVEGRLPDRLVATWAGSQDHWWRRTALVSTVALSRRGEPGDLRRVDRICALLVPDKDDMVIKALSWALREMAKKHPEEAENFLAEHKLVLSARVTREVSSKLTTGLKNPRTRRTGGV